MKLIYTQSFIGIINRLYKTEYVFIALLKVVLSNPHINSVNSKSSFYI